MNPSSFKQHLPIILAFALPIVLIAIVAVVAYVPSLMLETKYNFIYSSCPDYRYGYEGCEGKASTPTYAVVDGKLVVQGTSTASGAQNQNKVRLFLHDTKKNESREITVDEAKTLSLNGLVTSPDGVTVSSDYSGGGGFFPFYDNNSYYGYFLTKGSRKSKINLINDEQYYSRYSFRFIGWVLPGRN